MDKSKIKYFKRLRSQIWYLSSSEDSALLSHLMESIVGDINLLLLFCDDD